MGAKPPILLSLSPRNILPEMRDVLKGMGPQH